MINCGEISNDIFLKFLFFKWLISGWCHIWSWWVDHTEPSSLLPPPPLPPPSSPNCWGSYHWRVGCAKRDENDISIAKPCIHPYVCMVLQCLCQLVQELMKWYFQASAGHSCCLLFINQCSANIVTAVYHNYISLFLYPPNISKAQAFVYVFSPIAYCSLSTECSWLSLFFYDTTIFIWFWGMFFMTEIEKSLVLSCIRLHMTLTSLRGGSRTLPTYKL